MALQTTNRVDEVAPYSGIFYRVVLQTVSRRGILLHGASAVADL